MNPSCVTSFLPGLQRGTRDRGRRRQICGKGQFYRYSHPGRFRWMNCPSVFLCPPTQRSSLNDREPHRTWEVSTAAGRNQPSQPQMASKAAFSISKMQPAPQLGSLQEILFVLFQENCWLFFSGPSRSPTDGLRVSCCLQGGV